MDWEFSEDTAFQMLCQAFQESGEKSAMEFLANGEGESYYQELIQNAAGEGFDLSDTVEMNFLQDEIIERMELESKTSN
ncbi:MULTISPECIES: hypothetical protein [unclassified Prochlorococcus]|uniref:hypothetical protein n=1 Tax=unclassified Prochlorococcus TaxID=2627481 RepID=UPI000533880F|nr:MULTISPECIES: hypothetical protein [unclassified Prochlorococcus]KGG15283.1 hypothetical protein EV06_1154 [Prochlorococcus sp. MIT 0602]KGG17560.1 hypothetical protein EV07_1000 [Prochlorococcus sp. MIT 0603]